MARLSTRSPILPDTLEYTLERSRMNVISVTNRFQGRDIWKFIGKKFTGLTFFDGPIHF